MRDGLILTILYTSKAVNFGVLHISVCLNIVNRFTFAFVMAPILEHELDEFVYHWNTHQIHPSRDARCPGGIPEDLFDMPQSYGKHLCYNYVGCINIIVVKPLVVL